MVLRNLRCEKSTPVVTLFANRPRSEELLLLAGAKPLKAEAVSGPRSLVTCCRISGKSPATKNSETLKRVGRYLQARPVAAIVFEPQALPRVLQVFCDADHAGDM